MLIFLKLLLVELLVYRLYGLNKEVVALWRENKVNVLGYGFRLTQRHFLCIWTYRIESYSVLAKHQDGTIEEQKIAHFHSLCGNVACDNKAPKRRISDQRLYRHPIKRHRPT